MSEIYQLIADIKEAEMSPYSRVSGEDVERWKGRVREIEAK